MYTQRYIWFTVSELATFSHTQSTAHDRTKHDKSDDSGQRWKQENLKKINKTEANKSKTQ